MKRLLILFILICYTGYGQLQINEICSDNDELLESANGKYYDWLEIYNNSDSPVQLSNYYLTDDDEELEMWNFDSAILQAGEYIIVFASDDDIVVPNEQHANFKLSSKGETLYLSDGTNIIDRVEFGIINEDYTYGRLEESSELHTNLAKPTPGESNRNSGTIIADKESGYYTNEFDLNLKAAAGQKIYYTTNGDDPTTESLEYTGEIEIKDEYDYYKYLDVPTTPMDTLNCKFEWIKPENNIPRCKVVSYRIIDSNGEKGKVYRNTFFFENNHKLPVISIVTDNMGLFSQDTGIYVPGVLFDINNACWVGNYFVKHWERAATISYFENKKKIFDEYVGISISGGGTRSLPQKSIKFTAKKVYGINKFKNVFFPDSEEKEFNNLLIRTTMAGWYETIFKDALTLDIVKNLNMEPTSSKPVVVYINGNYWGISELRNILDEDYFSEKYDINKDSINIVGIDKMTFPKHGTYYDFESIYEFIVNNDLSIASNYEVVENRIEIDNLIDYYIAEMYFNNFDWPGNNFVFWNSKDLDNKYRPIFFDLDGCWYRYDFNMFEFTAQLEHEEWPNPKRVNVFQQKLLSNELFRSKFIERTLYLLENEFKFQKIEPMIAEFTSNYESEIENNINRFGFPKSKEMWLSNIDTYLTSFARERECYFREHLMDFFGLDSNVLCGLTPVDIALIDDLSISPNPATNFISVNNVISDYITIYDLHGTKLMKLNSKYKRSLEVDISSLAPSIYFVKMNNTMVKFIKIK